MGRTCSGPNSPMNCVQMRPSPWICGRACSVRLLALLAAPSTLLALAPAARAQVYFTAFPAEGGTSIERAAFDGSGLQTLQFQPIGFADGLALDMRDGKMYWTETSAGAIWRSNLNGTEAQTVLIDAGREPLGIALDLANEQMYWTDREGVKRAGIDGTGAELLTKETARGFIALDLATQQMFWADWMSGTIRSAPMTTAPVVTTIAKGQACPFGIAVDETSAVVYWLGLEVKERLKCENHSSISRAHLDGTKPQVIVERSRAGFEGGLAVDPVAGKIYWTEAEAHDIRTADLSGANESVLFGTGGDYPVGLAVETADPHPLGSSPPLIEGDPVVGSPLFCNAGTWAGTGPLSFTYQWVLAGTGALEGAVTSTFVPPTELTGATLRCVVTAGDSIGTTSLASPAVSVGAYPLAAPAPQPALVATIALAHLSARGSRVIVPVFTSVAGMATLEAIPRRGTPGGSARRHAPRAGHASTHARGRGQRAAARGTITVRRSLRAGRSGVALARLRRGVAYVLRLTVEDADGQTATSTATLSVARR
jgi:Low-density lipoprotein receptor repeat class B